MSVNLPANQRHRSRRSKIALAAALGLAAVAVPATAAAPAQAASTQYACSVTPLKPIYAGHNQSGTMLVNYRVYVYCYQGRYLNIQQQRWEDDDSWTPPFDGNDYLGGTNWTNVYVSAGGAVTLNNVRTLVNTEAGNEEVFQRTRFQEGYSGIWSAWTGWRNSANTSMPG
ncbi:hypothetical protein [Arthrobacter mobilis]|uniref:Uncharacterized protein n=1 Tax=Arthrobacter mobilis TaxID=2724944 RepID=A0A7X6HER7_9MICC|nr:hypothetical protein [Arthrobacter mobilis]NKX55804.1 hypothetical protein [Arthrobacter mobilis]